MPLTADQVRYIRNTWKYFRQIDFNVFGDALFTKLFVDYPFLKKVFRGDLSDQYYKLHHYLNTAVARIDHNDVAAEDFLTYFHPDHLPEFNATYFECLKEALIWTLQKGIGRDWLPEYGHAWSAYIQLLAEKHGKFSYQS